ncbi:MAG TPA: hypothetical protein ENJ97_06320 [Planctomycetes bacterium]|nr:hypothetical protein [Planctomycetota bacterium]
MKKALKKAPKAGTGRKGLLAFLLLVFLGPFLALPAGNWILCFRSAGLNLHLLGGDSLGVGISCCSGPGALHAGGGRREDHGSHARLAQPGPPRGLQGLLSFHGEAASLPRDAFPALEGSRVGPGEVNPGGPHPFHSPPLSALRSTILLL